MMNHFQEIQSMSLIHFLTNQIECYVRIKNIVTGKYLHIDTSPHEPNTIEKKVIGNGDGTIIILKPSYLLSKCYFIVISNVNSELHTKYYLTATHDSAIIKKTIDKCNDSLFYLDGTLDETYICANQIDKNMYGEIGRYLYMTDEDAVYVNGDQSIGASLWKIEKINGYQMFNDIRTDYKEKYDLVEKESKKNMNIMFSSIVKYFTIFNVENNIYLNVSLNKNKTFKRELFGYHEKMNFMIRPVPNENCIYISHYIGGKYVNLYTLPNSLEVYAGAPDCHWAKFYIIKSGNYYLFQCFHKETDKNGNYGRYLCMRNTIQDKYEIMGDGCFNEECSKWMLNIC
jgi:hypothetical protein